MKNIMAKNKFIDIIELGDLTLFEAYIANNPDALDNLPNTGFYEFRPIDEALDSLEKHKQSLQENNIDTTPEYEARKQLVFMMATRSEVFFSSTVETNRKLFKLAYNSGTLVQLKAVLAARDNTTHNNGYIIDSFEDLFPKDKPVDLERFEVVWEHIRSLTRDITYKSSYNYRDRQTVREYTYDIARLLTEACISRNVSAVKFLLNQAEVVEEISPLRNSCFEILKITNKRRDNFLTTLNAASRSDRVEIFNLVMSKISPEYIDDATKIINRICRFPTDYDKDIVARATQFKNSFQQHSEAERVLKTLKTDTILAIARGDTESATALSTSSSKFQKASAKVVNSADAVQLLAATATPGKPGKAPAGSASADSQYPAACTDDGAQR